MTSAFHLPPECTPRPGVKHSTHCKHFCVNVSYASAGHTVHFGSLLMKAGIRTSKAFIPAPFLTTQLGKRNYPEGDSGMEAILLVTIPSLSLSSSLQTKSSLQVPSKLSATQKSRQPPSPLPAPTYSASQYVLNEFPYSNQLSCHLTCGQGLFSGDPRHHDLKLPFGSQCNYVFTILMQFFRLSVLSHCQSV